MVSIPPEYGWSLVAHPERPETSSATDANSTGSPSAVVCRYSHPGLVTSRSTANHPAATERDATWVTRNTHTVSMTRHATFTGTTANPECHQELIAANGEVTRCGSGSHTVPIWVNPEWAPSVTQRAIDRCDRASAYSWGRP